jgi:hypothetical protein
VKPFSNDDRIFSELQMSVYLACRSVKCIYKRLQSNLHETTFSYRLCVLHSCKPFNGDDGNYAIAINEFSWNENKDNNNNKKLCINKQETRFVDYCIFYMSKCKLHDRMQLFWQLAGSQQRWYVKVVWQWSST